MCGIVGAIAQRDVAEILVNGLHRLEYRGYDSAGIAIVDQEKRLQRVRCLGKVQVLAEAVAAEKITGGTGIAIPAGQHMVRLLKIMHTLMYQVSLR